jgi:hypothetical protein
MFEPVKAPKITLWMSKCKTFSRERKFSQKQVHYGKSIGRAVYADVNQKLMFVPRYFLQENCGTVTFNPNPGIQILCSAFTSTDQ